MRGGEEGRVWKGEDRKGLRMRRGDGMETVWYWGSVREYEPGDEEEEYAGEMGRVREGVAVREESSEYTSLS